MQIFTAFGVSNGEMGILLLKWFTIIIKNVNSVIAFEDFMEPMNRDLVILIPINVYFIRNLTDSVYLFVLVTSTFKQHKNSWNFTHNRIKDFLLHVDVVYKTFK